MLDIIAILSKLSLKFQERDCTIADVQHSLQGAIDVLALYRPGPQLKQVLDCKEYKGYNRTGSGGPFNISATQARIVDSLTESLKQRFSDYDEGILSTTSVINLSSWPQTKTEANDFGNKSIEMLAKCFQPIMSSSSVSLDVTEPEWAYLKSLIYSRHKDKIETLSWSQINREFGSLCRNILSLVDLLLSLPATSVECERGFSAMRMVKDDWRND
ncbi:uncharacterized protein LOC121388014 [Gigantopelta aegis]|uniref:uncharacterized protein LOC121388014 n=1 Tax=Gigantopelta aegis TaxID=1735272 RepID=UPI001B88ABF3|nr:uncharacterized protein LOC121388014 [Gigantopelta aegis]